MIDPPESFFCVIHQGILVNPAVLRCGHSFCQDCIHQCLDKVSKCPSCRKEAKREDVAVNYQLRDLMADVLKPTIINASDIDSTNLLVRTTRAQLFTGRYVTKSMVWKQPYCTSDNVNSVKDDLVRIFQLFEALSDIEQFVVIYGVTLDPPGLVQERLSCSIQQCLHLKRSISLEEAEIIMEDVATSMFALHDNGFVHRDISSCSVLLRVRQSAITAAKIGDIDDSRTKNASLTQSVFGTAAYMAPEVLFGQCTKASPKADIFATGVLFWAVLTNQDPSHMAQNDPLLQLKRLKSHGAALIIIDLLPFKWKSLVCSMTQSNPEDRSSADHVLATVKMNLIGGDVLSATYVLKAPLPHQRISSKNLQSSVRRISRPQKWQLTRTKKLNLGDAKLIMHLKFM
ncbi:hypothetical protein P9112_010121 [Eukaryota sp. TZLM1-RC]